MVGKYNQADQRFSQTARDLKQMARERDRMLAQLLHTAQAVEDCHVLVAGARDEAALVFVPATLFIPGPPRATELERRQAERFVGAFYMDVYPVTNQQFARFVEATSYVTVAERQNGEEQRDGPTWRAPDESGGGIEDRQDHPVVWVHRADALAYARWAGRRLPTRLEWERAMRGVAGRTWPWGDEWEADRCNINSDGTTSVEYFEDGASPAGCMDMVGNVWEWTADELPGGKLLLMGGSWAEEQLKVGYKQLIVPGDGTDGATGFRCAMDAPSA
jgi:formylglycine-generating enzyme required for sulfatase activity